MVRHITPSEAHGHAEMLANRVRKNLRRMRPGFTRDEVDAFRVYDWDIPEVRAVVDHYAGHFVVAEFEREQTAALDYVGILVEGLCAGLELGPERVVGKVRRTRPRGGGHRYGRQDRRGERLVVQEGPLRFLVNLHDYLDTGLFCDHRRTRERVMASANDQRVLNLFAYTGSFSVAALAGGARSVTSVDLSSVYLAWAEDNLRENRLPLDRHTGVRSETRGFLQDAGRRGQRWDLIVLDPPSYSTVGGPGGLDVLRDHPVLLGEALACLAPGGELVFSTNHQRFEPRFDGLPAHIAEITDAVVPAEYRRTPHQTYSLRHPA